MFLCLSLNLIQRASRAALNPCLFSRSACSRRLQLLFSRAEKVLLREQQVSEKEAGQGPVQRAASGAGPLAHVRQTRGNPRQGT